MQLSKSQEDYLKIIWYMERDQIKATAKAVAVRHQVKSPTVLAMFRQLTRMGLIEYDRAVGARLSDVGGRLAHKLIRKHRLIETFLGTVLRMDDRLLHEEAEKLEHVISDHLMYRIDAYLGFPDRDPHGSPIPKWDEHLTLTTLDTLQLNQSFQVKEIQLDPELQAFYSERRFVRGSTWTLQDKTPDDSVYTLTNGQSFLALSAATVSKVKVISHY